MANNVTIHVKAEDHASRDMDVIGAKVETKAKRAFGRVGTNSGLAFAAGFIKTITFGQVGGGFAQSAVKMAPAAAKAGGVLGAGMAAGLILQLTNALSAGLPLALGGALLAGPLIYLWKNQEKAVKRLKDRAKDFIEFISEPVKIPFLRSLDAIGDGLKKVGVPLRRMLASIAPALEPLTKGAMKGLQAFITAIEPAMPSVAAGMEAWGKAAPKIGEGMGKLITKIMQDPEATVQAVQDLTDSLVGLMEDAGQVVRFLQDAATAYGRFSRTVDKFENSGGQGAGGGPLAGIVKGIKRDVPRIIAAVGRMGDRIGAEIQQAQRAATSRAKAILSGVVGTLRALPGRAAGAIGALSSRVASEVSQARAAAISRARALVSGFVSIMRTLPGRARAAIGSIRARIVGAFAGAGSWLVGAGRAIIRGLISGIRGAAGAAASAAASVVHRAIAAARSLIPGHAGGGLVSAAAGGGNHGGLVQVGERGPELVQLPGGSHVFPNGNSTMGKGGGGQSVHFHFHGPVYGDHNALKRALVNMKRAGDLDLVLR